MPFEWPHRTNRVGRPLGSGGGLRAHAQRRRIVPSCYDGLKSADSLVRQSAAHALGQLQAKEAVNELIALLKDETYGLRKRFRLKEASNTINKDNNFN